MVALVALNRRYETTSEGKIMKLAKRKGWSRLCGWKKAFKSRGEIFHKPGRLEAKTRMKGKSQMVEMKRAERRKK